VVGWIADEMPEVVRRVAEHGHEIASKGHFHRGIRQLSREEFRDDLVRSREALERAAGTPVFGYRIAEGWLGPQDLWALDVLAEEGFLYDSSIRPIFRGFAAQPERRRLHCHRHQGRTLWEFPIPSWTVAGWSLPIAGGNYLRQAPPALMRHAVARWQRAAPEPLLMYFHVWELDPDQPRIQAAPLWERVRQYRNLDRMDGILRSRGAPAGPFQDEGRQDHGWTSAVAGSSRGGPVPSPRPGGHGAHRFYSWQEAGMTTTALRDEELQLPSDQDASGRSLGREELQRLQEVLESGVLTSTKGTAVKAFERRFAATLGVRHAHACASGTAAIHAAVAAIDPEPGDEIVTSPITDMGALTPILYQGAIPVFADVDPRTCNVTAETIAARLNRRTRGIVVTHLFGNPCAIADIMKLARERRLPVIEDCAQAFGAASGGRPVGTIGAVGCFSLQQGKHITTGEGGLVVSSNEFLARRLFLFINKAWGYGDPMPDHTFLALNYRMSELQGAVALAQMDKLDGAVHQRVAMAERLTEHLAGLPGIRTPWVAPGNRHTYWKYCLWVDSRELPGGNQAVARLLRQKGISCAPRYIQKPAFECQIFRHQRTFGRSRFPFTLARPEAVDYSPALFAGTFQALDEVLVLPWNERYTEEHVDAIAAAVEEAVAALGGGRRRWA